MTPIVIKKCHFDQETGHMVEGLSTPFTCSPLFLTLILCPSFLTKMGTPGERIQRPGGGGNDGDSSSSEDEHED